MQKTQETRVQFLGREDLLEKEMASHSSILAWKVPWAEETGGLFLESQRVGHDWTTGHTCIGNYIQYLLITHNGNLKNITQFSVLLKLTQYCKSIIFQFFKKLHNQKTTTKKTTHSLWLAVKGQDQDRLLWSLLPFLLLF